MKAPSAVLHTQIAFTCCARPPAQRHACCRRPRTSVVTVRAGWTKLQSIPLASAPAWQPIAATLLVIPRAAADEASMPVQAAAQPGINPAEIALLAAPLVLYGVFNVYRDRVNPMAKLSDFIFIFAALVIVANILSIIIFKRQTQAGLEGLHSHSLLYYLSQQP